MDSEELMNLCQDLHRQGRQVWVLSSELDVLKGKAPIKEVKGVPLARMARTGGMRIQRAVKRAMDIVGSSIGILLLSPLLLLISLAVKLSSPGPVLFKQRRMGRGGRPFVLFKFRSMTADNDQSIHKKYWEGLRGNGQEAAIDKAGNRVYKLVDDPRVTKLGRLLRRWSLDELPQLFNVLAGHMSLVGPRPCVLYEWDSYQEWHRKRLAVDAGITGLWQVTGRSIVNFDEMVLLDLYYAANWSLWTDIKIMFRTVPAVFNGEGAH
jgi:exopolysaccharide biosynthesis polyprenyl glycosylphosphotransferase